MYQESRRNAVFFVFFIIVGFFYLHSLVLSVVFSTYIHAASDIHERSLSVREEAIRRAFLALRRDDVSEYISASSIRKTLQLVRPHYSTMKVSGFLPCSNQIIITSHLCHTDQSINEPRGSIRSACYRFSYISNSNSSISKRFDSNNKK